MMPFGCQSGHLKLHRRADSSLAMYHYSSLESACALMKGTYVCIARIQIWLKFKCPHLYLIACCLLASSTVEIKRSVWPTKLNFSFGCSGTLLVSGFHTDSACPPPKMWVADVLDHFFSGASCWCVSKENTQLFIAWVWQMILCCLHLKTWLSIRLHGLFARCWWYLRQCCSTPLQGVSWYRVRPVTSTLVSKQWGCTVNLE